MAEKNPEREKKSPNNSRSDFTLTSHNWEGELTIVADVSPDWSGTEKCPEISGLKASGKQSTQENLAEKTPSVAAGIIMDVPFGAEQQAKPSVGSADEARHHTRRSEDLAACFGKNYQLPKYRIMVDRLSIGSNEGDRGTSREGDRTRRERYPEYSDTVAPEHEGTCWPCKGLVPPLRMESGRLRERVPEYGQIEGLRIIGSGSARARISGIAGQDPREGPPGNAGGLDSAGTNRSGRGQNPEYQKIHGRTLKERVPEYGEMDELKILGKGMTIEGGKVEMMVVGRKITPPPEYTEEAQALSHRTPTPEHLGGGPETTEDKSSSFQKQPGPDFLLLEATRDGKYLAKKRSGARRSKTARRARLETTEENSPSIEQPETDLPFLQLLEATRGKSLLETSRSKTTRDDSLLKEESKITKKRPSNPIPKAPSPTPFSLRAPPPTPIYPRAPPPTPVSPRAPPPTPVSPRTPPPTPISPRTRPPPTPDSPRVSLAIVFSPPSVSPRSLKLWKRPDTARVYPIISQPEPLKFYNGPEKNRVKSPIKNTKLQSTLPASAGAGCGTNSRKESTKKRRGNKTPPLKSPRYIKQIRHQEEPLPSLDVVYCTYEPNPIAKGLRRVVYEGKYIRPDLKKEKPCVLKDEEGLTILACKKAIQVQRMAKNLADEFNKERISPKAVEFVDIAACFQDRTHELVQDKKLFLVEDFIPGSFQKYSNNYGKSGNFVSNTLSCFMHWSFVKTGGRLLISNLHGVRFKDKYRLTDPIFLSNRTDNYFGETDTGPEGIALFFYEHKCLSMCQNLPVPSPDSFGSYLTGSVWLQHFSLINSTVYRNRLVIQSEYLPCLVEQLKELSERDKQPRR